MHGSKVADLFVNNNRVEISDVEPGFYFVLFKHTNTQQKFVKKISIN
jgi:hypothetical protein